MASRFDLVIVGMGSAGMVAAKFAAGLGLSVAAVERDRFGGDCLWTGCVPSKSLLAAGKVAHHMRIADRFGIRSAVPDVDLSAVWRRVRMVQAEIAGTDDEPGRFIAMGIDVVFGSGRLTSPTTVQVGDRALDTRFVLLCPGGRPAAPSIPGLAAAGYLNSENLFELETPPASFVCIGGGPIAIEMAQAFVRLGIAVTVLQKGKRCLPRDEPSLVDALVEQLRAEGVELFLDVEIDRVEIQDGRKVVTGRAGGSEHRWPAEELLVATGRSANVADLGLADVGIATGARGIEVDDRGRTARHTVYACGDAVGRNLFTHSAAYEGVRAVRDMFFPGRGKVTAEVPWCTFTDPELAHVGMTEAEARAEHGDDVKIRRQDLVHNDRSRADGATGGAVIVVTHKRRIVGAHILAPAAGEMIHEFAFAIAQGHKLDALSSFMHVYPTLSTSVGQLAADASFERAEKLRWLVRR